MTTAEIGEDFISHHGILGMKWGEHHRQQHSKSPQPVKVSESVGGNYVKTRLATSGGESHPAHPQAVQIAATRQKLKKSGVHTLSNDELQALVVRGNLEQQAHSLETRRSVGRQFVEQQKAQAAAHPITTVRRVRKGVKAVSLALPI